jgi:hypothetical protein
MENHGLQCGYCTPGMVMAATSLLKENPNPTEARRAPRARGQPVPLHGLPQHRAGRAGRAAEPTSLGHTSPHVTRTRQRDGGPAMTMTKRHRGCSASGCCARKIRRCSPARRSSPTTCTCRGRCTWRCCAARTPTPASCGRREPGARRCPACVAAYSGADLADLWAAPMPCAWPVTDDMKNPPHHPLATDKVCYVGDGVACVLATSDAAARDALEPSRSTTSHCRPSPTSRTRSATGSSSTTTSAPTAATPGTSRSRTTRVPSTRRSPPRPHRERALRPAAPDPDGDGAAGRAVDAAALRRRRHAVLATQVPTS